MKDEATVIEEFNDIVNMTVSELQDWLKSADSQSAGWAKDDEAGESVGHDSGRKIVAILEANPEKEADKYTEDQVQHMRKVVSYCKRHLAQEEKANSEKSVSEVKKTKSYASLKNWGHDMLKKRFDGKSSGENGSKEQAADGTHAGDKRKASHTSASPNKKRETDGGEAGGDDGEAGHMNGGDGAKSNSNSNGATSKEEDADEGEEEDNVEEEAEADDDYEQEGVGDATADTSGNGPKVGDTVSWNWGAGQPQGKVVDVKPEKATIVTKRGNEASRNGNPEDPAVVIDTRKSTAVKAAHELN